MLLCDVIPHLSHSPSSPFILRDLCFSIWLIMENISPEDISFLFLCTAFDNKNHHTRKLSESKIYFISLQTVHEIAIKCCREKNLKKTLLCREMFLWGFFIKLYIFSVCFGVLNEEQLCYICFLEEKVVIVFCPRVEQWEINLYNIWTLIIQLEQPQTDEKLF